MHSPASPPKFLNWLKRLSRRGLWVPPGSGGGPWGPGERWKGPAEWPLSFCVPNLPSNCPQAEGCFVPGNSGGLTLPLASASDPSSKSGPLRPARPVSTSKCPEPAISWWSSAHAASHAGIVWYSDCEHSYHAASLTTLLFSPFVSAFRHSLYLCLSSDMKTSAIVFPHLSLFWLYLIKTQEVTSAGSNSQQVYHLANLTVVALYWIPALVPTRIPVFAHSAW